MKAIVVCNEVKANIQGYEYWYFHFKYTCPKCRHEVSTQYCGDCGTKIEYPHKPDDFELYDMNGEWHYSE